MLADQFTAAAVAAKNTAAVDEIARLTWRAHAEGHLSDIEAHTVGEAVQSRRKAFSDRGASQALQKAATLARQTGLTRTPPPSSHERGRAGQDRRLVHHG